MHDRTANVSLLPALAAALCFAVGCSKEVQERVEPRPPSALIHLFDHPVDEVKIDQEGLARVAAMLSSEVVWVMDEPLPPGAFGRRDRMDRDDGVDVWGARTRFKVAGGTYAGRAPQKEALLENPKRGSARKPPSVNDLKLDEYFVDSRGVLVGRAPGAGRPGQFLADYPAHASELLLSAVTPAPVIDQVPSAPSLLLRGDTRRHVMLPEGSAVSWVVDLKPESELRFSYGLNGLRLKPHDRGGIFAGRMAFRAATFQIEVETTNGERTVIWEQEVKAKESGMFLDARADLRPFAGQTVRVWLRTLPQPDQADEPVHPFWAEPYICDPMPVKRPNVIVLVLDTLRADRLGCYGYERAKTPNLDALAAESALFTRSWGAAPWTLPSHASLFSSLYLTEHGVTDPSKRLSQQAYTLAEFMRDHGYSTAAFTESGFVRPEYGFEQGFDQFWYHAGDVEVTMRRGTAWLDSVDRPFFLFLHTYKVHSPHEPSQAARDLLVRPYDGPLPAVVHTPDYPWGQRQDPQPSAADVQYISDLYDAEIADLDRAVGGLVSWLKAKGLYEDLVFIVTSDHGEEFSEHGHFEHGWSLYEEQLHVPLIVRATGAFPDGVVSARPAIGLDIAPTIAELIGCAAPRGWSGVSLLAAPSIEERPMWVPYVTRDTLKPAVAALRGDRKYIEFPSAGRPNDPNPDQTLFDLSTDQQERFNLWERAMASDWEAAVESYGRRYPARNYATSTERSSELDDTLRALGYLGDD